jgi:hypothetical protein
MAAGPVIEFTLIFVDNIVPFTRKRAVLTQKPPARATGIGYPPRAGGKPRR